MQIRFSDSRFLHFFITDKSMFSLGICRYSMRKLMIEVLKMVESVQFCLKIRVPGKPGPLGLDQKSCPGVARGRDGNAWN